MRVFDRLRELFGAKPRRAAPKNDAARGFYRFTDVDALMREGGDPLHAAVVTGAFHDCMLRIVARHAHLETIVEVDALDVTSLPVIPRCATLAPAILSSLRPS
jgi:hypothetical protein